MCAILCVHLFREKSWRVVLDVHPFEYYCMILRTETGLMLEPNLLKFQFVHEAFIFLFLRFAKHSKKSKGTFVAPSLLSFRFVKKRKYMK